ncbi:MAG TPA: hypothetical protein VNT75_22295 [Symbiobacteriaceae bacterium]|nr:hypothetical protein [Symbiobacteriaceae bacterium]
MPRSFSERIMSGTAHLITLVGVLHLMINIIGFPLFPKSTIIWLIPNTVFAIVAFKWSHFAYSHVAQALSLHLSGVALAVVPWIIRLLGLAGVMSEKWYYTGWEGSGATPAWSLATGIIAFLGLVIFCLASEAAVRGYTGDYFQYPLIGKIAKRITQ